MVDTHTADGLKVAREHREPGVPMIVLETALPAKFAATIREALGREPERPAALEGIESTAQALHGDAGEPSRSSATSQHALRGMSARLPADARPLLTPGRGAGAPAGRCRAARRSPRPRRVSTFDALGRVLARRRALGRSTCRRADNTRWTAMRVRVADVPARRRAAAGGAAHPRRRGRPAAGSRAPPRASSPARRCRPGADAVVMQEQCERRRRSAVRRQHACRSPASGSAARGEDIAPARTVLCRRHAADAAGAGPGGLGRRWPRCRCCAARAWRCSPPATNW